MLSLGHRLVNVDGVWLIFGEDALAGSTASFPRGVGCVIWRTGFENSDDVDGQDVARAALAWATFRNWSRYGQLEERRITMRRAETTTSYATLISRVRQVLM